MPCQGVATVCALSVKVYWYQPYCCGMMFGIRASDWRALARTCSGCTNHPPTSVPVAGFSSSFDAGRKVLPSAIPASGFSTDGTAIPRFTSAASSFFASQQRNISAVAARSLPSGKPSASSKPNAKGSQPYLEGLNEEQREAVQCPNSAVRVKAGPGSGKTRVVTSRVAHMLASGVHASNVLGGYWADGA